jgi:hypothetical protein
MRYKDLINHLDPIIRQTWMESGEDEIGRLFQGFGDVEGKHVLEFIHKSEIPIKRYNQLKVRIAEE